MASKTYDFAFKILGGLDPQFARSFQQATGQIKNHNRTLSELEQNLKAMEDAYRKGIISERSFTNNKSALINKINQETQAIEKLTQQQKEYQEAQNAISGLGGGISGAVSGIAAGLGVGAVLSQVGAYQQALGQAQALTGAVGQDWENISTAINNTYLTGLGADLQDVANSTGQIRQIIGNLGTDIDKAVQHALVLRDTFGMEITESARAAKVMMEQFRISEQQAYTLMAQGAQLGADKNGDLLDTLNEYSVQFKQLGFDAESFMNILVAGANSGVWSIDKIGDAVKEFGIRVKDGSKTTAEGFSTIGLDVDEMAQKFAKGGESAQNAFLETINALKAVDDPVQRNIAGVNLFGTMWEDMGEKAVFALADTNNAVNMNGQTLDDITNNKLNNFNTAITKLGRVLMVNIIGPLSEQLTPEINAFSEAITAITPDVLVASIAGIGAAIAAFQIGSFLASFGGIAAAATAAGAAITAISWPIIAATVVIGALVAAGVYLYQNWDVISAKASELYDNVSASFAELYNSVISEINRITAEGMALWEQFTSFLSHPIDSTINLVRNIITNDDGGADVPGFASGGLINRPTLATFAENSPEMAIPINGSDRSIGLWQQAGQMLGVDSSIPASSNTTNYGGNITFAPTITIQGNADRVDIQSAVKDAYSEFKNMMSRYAREQRRLSYE